MAVRPGSGAQGSRGGQHQHHSAAAAAAGSAAAAARAASPSPSPLSGGGLASLRSPLVRVEAPLVDVQSDTHEALSVHTHLPPGRRSSQARQSIISPNINLNEAHSSLEQHNPSSAPAALGAAAAAAKQQLARSGGSTGADSEEDYIEQPLSDSSADNRDSLRQHAGRRVAKRHARSQRQQQQHPHPQSGGGGGDARPFLSPSHAQAVSLPIHEHDIGDEQLMDVEVVDEQEQMQEQQATQQQHSRAGSQAAHSVHDDSHSDASSVIDLERALRQSRAENDQLSAQNGGLSGIIRQMKRELEQLLTEQNNQAHEKASAEGSAQAKLQAELEAKNKELAELKEKAAAQPQTLHPYYAPQFPPSAQFLCSRHITVRRCYWIRPSAHFSFRSSNHSSVLARSLRSLWLA